MNPQCPANFPKTKESPMLGKDFQTRKIQIPKCPSNLQTN
jgi:hypothetical protein